MYSYSCIVLFQTHKLTQLTLLYTATSFEYFIILINIYNFFQYFSDKFGYLQSDWSARFRAECTNSCTCSSPDLLHTCLPHPSREGLAPRLDRYLPKQGERGLIVRLERHRWHSEMLLDLCTPGILGLLRVILLLLVPPSLQHKRQGEPVSIRATVFFWVRTLVPSIWLRSSIHVAWPLLGRWGMVTFLQRLG